jgi:hypothetical protein
MLLGLEREIGVETDESDLIFKSKMVLGYQKEVAADKSMYPDFKFNMQKIHQYWMKKLRDYESKKKYLNVIQARLGSWLGQVGPWVLFDDAVETLDSDLGINNAAEYIRGLPESPQSPIILKKVPVRVNQRVTQRMRSISRGTIMCPGISSISNTSHQTKACCQTQKKSPHPRSRRFEGGIVLMSLSTI